MLRAPPLGYPLQKRTVVQLDMGALLGREGGADESMFLQFGRSFFIEAKRTMLKNADDYERLAQRAEERAAGRWSQSK
jgi:hypothetical protein